MAKPARKPKLKTYHATVHVVRVEEWCVEAESAEEASALLAAGHGHRCSSGDCLSINLDTLHSD